MIRWNRVEKREIHKKSKFDGKDKKLQSKLTTSPFDMRLGCGHLKNYSTYLMQNMTKLATLSVIRPHIRVGQTAVSYSIKIPVI